MPHGTCGGVGIAGHALHVSPYAVLSTWCRTNTDRVAMDTILENGVSPSITLSAST